MRLKLFLLLSTLSACAYAADNARDLQPAPPPPPLDSGSAKDAAPARNAAGDASSPEGPQVTITKKTGQTIEEYRVGGRLYMIKVTPRYGKPYYLVDDRGDGKFVRQETLDNGFRVPRWVIHRF
jgi:Protein of unknown function (DUF2782)